MYFIRNNNKLTKFEEKVKSGADIFNLWARIGCHLTEAWIKDSSNKILYWSDRLSGKRANKKKIQRIYVENIFHIHVCACVCVYTCSFIHIPHLTQVLEDFHSNVCIWCMFRCVCVVYVCCMCIAYMHSEEIDDHDDEGEVKP